MISSNANVQKQSKNQTLRQDLLCNSHHHTSPFQEDVERELVPDCGGRVMEMEGNGVVGARGSRQRTWTARELRCTHQLRVSNSVSRGYDRCDEGQWLRLPCLGWRQKQRHESPIKPGGKGQISIQKINLRLTHFQKSDWGWQEIAFLEIRGFKAREMRWFQSTWEKNI